MNTMQTAQSMLMTIGSIMLLFFLLTGIAEASFIDNGDGTVIDTASGLQWQEAAMDLDNDNIPDPLTWEEALAACENLDLAGHADWRLPNIFELRSIVDYSRSNPTADPLFPMTSMSASFTHWSSTTSAYNQGSAWFVYFNNGNHFFGSKGDTYYVRAVRDNPQHVDSFTLSTLLEGSGSGSVTIDPPGDLCTTNCTRGYVADTLVTLSATADPGSVFMGWPGVCQGVGDCVVTMDRSRLVTAFFQRETPVDYAITILKTGNGTGSVMGLDVDCDAACTTTTREYNDPTRITLSATPAADSIFSGWFGPCSGTGECTVDVNDILGVTAKFEKQHDVGIDVYKATDYPTQNEDTNAFLVRVENLGALSAVGFTVHVTVTQGEAGLVSWSGGCGDIPDGVTCSASPDASGNGAVFTLGLDVGAYIDLKFRFNASDSNFNTLTVAASLDYPADNDPSNNQDSRTAHIDPEYLPRPENLTLLLGPMNQPAANNTLVFTHGWQSDNPKGCTDFDSTDDGRKSRLECFATKIWTGFNPGKGQAAALAAKNWSASTPNSISTPVNIWQFVWEGAFTEDYLTIPFFNLRKAGYIAARRNVQRAGRELADKLIERLGTSYNKKIQFVGHSLGTAVNAYAVRYFLEEVPAATVQMTILDHPNRVSRIPGISNDEEKRWGFDENFFAAVIPALNDPGKSYKLFIDNYFSEGSRSESGLLTAGVGTRINGANVYNHLVRHFDLLVWHTGLHDPNDIGGIFFPEEGVGSYFDNDHTGVHQWYRWTMWPSSKQYLFDNWFKCTDRIAKSDWNTVLWGHDFHTTLNPCASGFAYSIVQDIPLPFPHPNGCDLFPERVCPDFVSPAANFDLLGGHADNYCILQEPPDFQIICSTSYPQAVQQLQSTSSPTVTSKAVASVPSAAPYAKFIVNLFHETRYLSLLYKFKDVQGDEFVHLLVDGDIMWSMPAQGNEPDTWMDTGKLPVVLSRGEHEVMLVFNGTTTDASTFSLKDLQFFQDPETASFPWTLFLPVMTGAGASNR